MGLANSVFSFINGTKQVDQIKWQTGVQTHDEAVANVMLKHLIIGYCMLKHPVREMKTASGHIHKTKLSVRKRIQMFTVSYKGNVLKSNQSKCWNNCV